MEPDLKAVSENPVAEQPSPTSAEEVPAEDVKDRIQSEQLRLLYSSIGKAIASTVVNTSLIVYICWDVVSHAVLIAWMAINWSIALIGVGTVAYYRRDAAAAAHNRQWRRLLFARLALAGAAFGSLAVFFTMAVPLTYQAFYFLVCGGMMAGAAGVYSVRTEMYVAYALPVSLPLTIRLFTYHGQLYYAMGVMVPLFFAILFSTVRSMHASSREALTLRFKNEDLVKKLSDEKSNVEKANQQLAHARDELWGEMQLARKIQTVLLPQAPAVPGYRIAAYMEPADEVGGDYYDVINVGGRNWVVIGDVSGHGVVAGLVMMMAQTAIQAVLARSPRLSPPELLVAVNGVLSENVRRLGDDKYMTLTVIAVEDEGGLRFAGLHQDILIYRKEADAVEAIPTEGLWIGLQDDIEGMVPEDCATVDVGDTVLLYTDGITEARARGAHPQRSSDGRYGVEQLSQQLKSVGKLAPLEIKDALVQSLAEYETSDDVTVVVLSREA